MRGRETAKQREIDRENTGKGNFNHAIRIEDTKKLPFSGSPGVNIVRFWAGQNIAPSKFRLASNPENLLIPSDYVTAVVDPSPDNVSTPPSDSPAPADPSTRLKKH